MPVQITGTITDFSNNIATGGYIQFDIQPLNQGLNYSVPAVGVIVATTSKCGINSSGQPTNYITGSGNCVVWPNDLIVPSNTLYKVTIAPNNTITRVYNNVLIKSVTNPQSLATLTFVQPQGQVVGTVVNGNPLATMSVIPQTDSVWTLGDPQHYFAAVYARNINTTAQTIQINGGSPLTSPFNFINGAGIIITNPSLGNIQIGLANLLSAGSCTFCNVTFNAQGQITSVTSGTPGTVFSVSVGNLAGLFTASVSSPSVNPSITFTPVSYNAHTFYGNNTNIPANPSPSTIGTGDLPYTYTGNTTELCTATGVFTSGHLVSIDTNGNCVDSGVVSTAAPNGGSTTSTCTTAASANATCTSTVNLSFTEPNTNYFVSCTGVGIASGFPYIATATKGTSSVTVTTSNGQGSAAVASSYTEIDCVVTGS